jgi:hypothetical protein
MDARPFPRILWPLFLALLGLALFAIPQTTADDSPVAERPAKELTAAERGYRHLLETPYIPAHFDQETFDQLWRVWPEAERKMAEQVEPEVRRVMLFQRYGLTPRPDDESGKPLQFVVDDEGHWSMNCFACHGGELDGFTVPGLPNTRIALQTLFDDVFRTKQLLEKPLTPYDLGSRVIPMGHSNGTTNAVTFSVALLQLRNTDLKVVRAPTSLVNAKHHDLDAPPWWNVRRRPHMYIDGFAPKNPRTLMQFMLVPANGKEKLVEAEADYSDILAYIESLPVPKWPGKIDQALARKGAGVFRLKCAGCHGTYDESPRYPNRIVDIDQVGTDRLRLDALTVDQRKTYAVSWFTKYDSTGVRPDPGGYLAPPLDGIWASAPYLHNGSVPTLWHLLHEKERPLVWKRKKGGYDWTRVGLPVDALEDLPPEATTAAEKRTCFDTRLSGKSAKGHTFPESLSEPQKRALLEYLKTL